MSVHRDDQMVRKYRIRIHKDMIFLSLASLKLHECLYIGTVLSAKKTLPLGYILLGQLCCRGYHSGRIELKLYGQSSDLDFPYTDILQSPEVITRKRPA